MKYLIVLALFAAVAFLVYWRLRPYIRGVRRLLEAARLDERGREALHGHLLLWV